jgi:hypothetical protein
MRVYSCDNSKPSMLAGLGYSKVIEVMGRKPDLRCQYESESPLQRKLPLVGPIPSLAHLLFMALAPE